MEQHKCMKDRLSAASILHGFALPCPLVVDGMDNKLCAQLQCSPERVVIALDGKIVFATPRGPYDYTLETMVDWMDDYEKEKISKVGTYKKK